MAIAIVPDGGIRAFARAADPRKDMTGNERTEDLVVPVHPSLGGDTSLGRAGRRYDWGSVLGS